MYIMRKHRRPPPDKPSSSHRFMFPNHHRPRNREPCHCSLIIASRPDWEEASVPPALPASPSRRRSRAGPGPGRPSRTAAQEACGRPGFLRAGILLQDAATRALSLGLRKRTHFFSNTKDRLLNHKSTLPSGFAQIGFFLPKC